MKSMVLLLCVFSVSSVMSQSLSLPELEKFFNMTSYTDRESLLIDKGFTFESNEKFDIQGTNDHQTIFTKGISEFSRGNYHQEMLLWTFEMSTKSFGYKTYDPKFYAALVQKIKEKYKKGVETTDDKGDITVHYSSPQISIKVNISKNDKQIYMYNLLFSKLR